MARHMLRCAVMLLLITTVTRLHQSAHVITCHEYRIESFLLTRFGHMLQSKRPFQLRDHESGRSDATHIGPL